MRFSFRFEGSVDFLVHTRIADKKARAPVISFDSTRDAKQRNHFGF